MFWTSSNNGIEIAQYLGNVDHNEISDNRLDLDGSAGKTQDFAFVFFA